LGQRLEAGLKQEEMKVIDVYRVKNRERNSVLFLCSVALSAFLIGQTANAYQEEVVAQGGTITGVVKFSGIVPLSQTYKVTMGSNPEFCRTIADEKGIIDIAQVRVSSKQTVEDVVVFLQEVERGKAVPKDGPVVTVDQCRFGPRIIGTMADQTLRVVMRDPILHQLRGWEILDKGRLQLFHLANLNEGGEEAVLLKTRRSSIIRLECDQHRFMQSWLLLTANPYVAVTDRHGAFHLTDVPVGNHTVGAWHPALGYQEAKITLRPGRQKNLELTFTSLPQP
jgi:hypothetical protein